MTQRRARRLIATNTAANPIAINTDSRGSGMAATCVKRMPQIDDVKCRGDDEIHEWWDQYVARLHGRGEGSPGF